MPNIEYPGVALFWEMNADSGHVVIAIRAPTHYLDSFSSPQDVLMRFLEALESRGITMTNMDEVRVRINQSAGTFVSKWVGHVGQPREALQAEIKSLTTTLGVQQFGD